jgi:hypothetical protein
VNETELLQRFQRENPDFASLPESLRTVIVQSVLNSASLGIPLEEGLDIASKGAREALNLPQPLSAGQFALDEEMERLRQDRQRRGQL